MLAPHEITDLSHFNDLHRRVREYFAGHATAEAVRQAGEALDQILGSLLATFHEELRYQVSLEELEEAALVVYEEFSWLRVELPLVGLAVESQDPEAAEEHLQASRGSLQTVLQIFQELREQDARRPRLSPIPLAHEVLRVGQLVLDELLPAPLLLERLQHYRLFHDRLADGLRELQPSEPEREVWEGSQSALTEALSLQDQAIRALEQALHRQDSSLLELGLEQLGEAADVLVGVQQALAGAGSLPLSRLCPRCAHDNPVTARHCGGCGAQLPVQERGASTLEVAEHPQDHPAPQIQHLLALAEGFRTHEVTLEVLQAEVEGLAQKIELAHRRLKSLKSPASDTPAEQLALYQMARQDMLDGLALFELGLLQLRQGQVCGAQAVAEAAERLLQIQPRWEAFLQNDGDAGVGLGQAHRIVD